MNKKKWVLLIALFFIAVALIMFSVRGKENTLLDYFWGPLVLSAVFLFAATRIK